MIQINDLSYEIGGFKLEDINIAVPAGEYMALLGPAGAGKSILLECICGIRQRSNGRVYVNSENITKLSPRKRNVGYVPQDFVLFDHLNVRDNIAFSLKVQRIEKEERYRQVEGIAEMLGITYLLDRRADSLSSGEKQLTSLARTLIWRPSVLLLDEPVCDIDDSRRMEICRILKMIAADFEMTVIHATNDMEEAFSVATKAVILNEGKVVQQGKPGELMRYPETEFVARFMRCENIFISKAIGPLFKGATEAVVGNTPLIVGARFTGLAKLMIRPENVDVFSPEAAIDLENMFIASLAGWKDFGNYVRLEIAGPIPLVANVDYDRFARLNVASSSRVVVRLRPDNIRLLLDKVVLEEPKTEAEEDETKAVEEKRKKGLIGKKFKICK